MTPMSKQDQDTTKKAVQQGRSERRGEAGEGEDTLQYVESLSNARTQLADFFSILLREAWIEYFGD